MNLVFLSPHFPPNFYNFCIALRQAGGTVLGIAEVPTEALRPELREALNAYYRVNNMADYDEMVRAFGYFTHAFGKIDRVESHNEHWLTLEAQLREDFNLIGPRPADTQRLKRKSLMKEVFQAAGVPSARGGLFRSKAEVVEFARTTGYPVFAKPDIGVGAGGTWKIESPADLDRFWEQKPPEDYFFEEFIDGRLATFDGLTDQDGNIIYHTAHHSETGCFELVAYNVDLNYYSLRDIPADQVELGTKAVKAFNVREKFFHFEFLRRKTDGQLFALELNCRPPGGFSTDMMNFASDIDVYSEWAHILMENRFHGQLERKYHCAHVARRNGKSYRLSHEDILKVHGDKVVSFTEVAPVFSGVMGDFAYLVRTPDLQELLRAIHDIQETA